MINTIQDIVTLLNGCFGSRIRDVSITTENPFQAASNMGGYVAYNATSIRPLIHMKFTIDLPTKIPKCMGNKITATQTMSNSAGDCYMHCTIMIGSIDDFVKELKTELWKEYSEKFDSFMDKLLSEESEN